MAGERQQITDALLFHSQHSGTNASGELWENWIQSGSALSWGKGKDACHRLAVTLLALA